MSKLPEKLELILINDALYGGAVSNILLSQSSKYGGYSNVINGNMIGGCAEFNAANKLLLTYPSATLNSIKYTVPIRPRNLGIGIPCVNCQNILGL